MTKGYPIGLSLQRRLCGKVHHAIAASQSSGNSVQIPLTMISMVRHGVSR
jgi:hypothetical protein